MGCNPMIWTILPHDTWGEPHDLDKKNDHTKIPYDTWGINPITKIKFNFFDKIKNQLSKINQTR